jgi:hypothetical protein
MNRRFLARQKLGYRGLWLLVLLSGATVVGCSGSKSANSPTSSQQPMTNLQPAFNVSAKTKLFLKAVESELREQKASLAGYVPSAEVVERYNLSKRGEQYYFSGFMTAGEGLDKAVIEAMGAVFGTSTGDQHTVQVPLRGMDQFFQSNTITFFQISEKGSTN